MTELNIGDHLHRAVKLAMDSGEVQSSEEAHRLFKGYKLALDIGPDIQHSGTLQASLLTAVNTGRRCFLGGVEVSGQVDVQLIVPWNACQTLSEAIRSLGGSIVPQLTPEIPRIAIGNISDRKNAGDFFVRATFNGWSGGVIPFDDGGRLEEGQEFIPAGVLSGSIAVSEAFQFIRGSNALAGKRCTGLSLWRPEQSNSWLEVRDQGPEIELLPSKVWIIGLGHLGQAFLWTLGLLPYNRPDDVLLVLHDFDILVPANESTSLLTFPPMTGRKKAREMATWCEKRGFKTVINERRFDGKFNIAENEPRIALCGVDNAPARADLEDVGFSRVIEAGLGIGTQEYLAIQMHTFPGPLTARTKWGGRTSQDSAEQIMSQPAYQNLSDKGINRCGLIDLAGRSVGASFVGAVASSLVISELLRMLHGQHEYALFDGSLRSLNHLSAIVNNQAVGPFNPGYTLAKTR